MEEKKMYVRVYMPFCKIFCVFLNFFLIIIIFLTEKEIRKYLFNIFEKFHKKYIYIFTYFYTTL